MTDVPARSGGRQHRSSMPDRDLTTPCAPTHRRARSPELWASHSGTRRDWLAHNSGGAARIASGAALATTSGGRRVRQSDPLRGGPLPDGLLEQADLLLEDSDFAADALLGHLAGRLHLLERLLRLLTPHRDEGRVSEVIQECLRTANSLRGASDGMMRGRVESWRASRESKVESDTS